MPNFEPVKPEELKYFREKMKYNKATLAACLGSKLRTVEDWEAGRRQPPAILRLALAAQELAIRPWEIPKQLNPTSSGDELDGAIFSRLWDKAQSQVFDTHYAWQDCIGAETNNAMLLLMAYVISTTDGYNDIVAGRNWENLPRSDFQTTAVFQPDLYGTKPTIAFECRCEEAYRHLAVFVDTNSPGERLPEKLLAENTLIAKNVRVLVFSETEVLADPEECCNRITNILCRLCEQCIDEHLSSSKG